MNDLYFALENMNNNDGMTLKNYNAVKYKTGYQVADFGKETKTVDDAIKAIVSFKGNCGIWYSEGIYYIDHSFRVKTKKMALQVGRDNNQQSVLRWRDMALVWC